MHDCFHTSVMVHRTPSVLHVQTHLAPVVMLHCFHTGHSSPSTISFTCSDPSWSCGHASSLPQVTVHQAPSVLHVQTHLAPVVMLHCFHTSVMVHWAPSVLHVQTHLAPVVMLHCIHTSVMVHWAPSVLHVQTHLAPVVMLQCIHTVHSSPSTISYTCVDLSCLCGHVSLLPPESRPTLWPVLLMDKIIIIYSNDYQNNNDGSKLTFVWYASLTHWGRVKHIGISKLTIIGEDHGCRLDGTKPLSEALLEYCELDPWE